MVILNWLLSYWDSVLMVLIVLIVLIFLAAKKQYGILDKIVFSLVTEAEKQFGGGTGAVKLAAVIDWVYPRVPAILRLFITAAQLTRLIEKVLAEAKTKWENNPKISTYIDG